jgi:hypothetical protein
MVSQVIQSFREDLVVTKAEGIYIYIYNFSFKTSGKLLGRPRHRWEGNIRIYLKETGCKVVG